jgi:Fungal specific transcription factor domain
VEFAVPEPQADENDEAISRITEIARTEAYHLVRSWPLSNGTGFETPDLPYVHFFMNQMGNYLWFAGITQPVARYIMAKALEQPVLQHAVICTSAALLSDRNVGVPNKYLEHKQKTLGLLRGHLNTMEINEGVAAAIFFMLFVDIGHTGARSHLRGLKSVLDYLRIKDSIKNIDANPEETTSDLIRNPGSHNSDVSGVSPLAWLLWAWGIRMDIALATMDGHPMIAPLAEGPEQEAFHRSWISSLSDPSIPDSTDWGLANFILDNIMHRGVHVARKARVIRTSPNYTLEDEQTIQRLCRQVDYDLEQWRALPILQRARRKEEDLNNKTSLPPDRCFLHYQSLIVYNSMYANLTIDYYCAKLYLSLVEYPCAGPNPAGSGRFQHAVEICRILASKPLYERDDVRGAEEVMCLFLAGLVFGGEESYPLETRWVQQALEQYFPNWTGSMSKEHLLGIWLENCPCVPMVREKNFPWVILTSIGVESNKSDQSAWLDYD